MLITSKRDGHMPSAAMEQKPRTMSTKLEIDNFGYTDINHAQKALIASLELALVKDLDGDHRGVLDGATQQ